MSTLRNTGRRPVRGRHIARVATALGTAVAAGATAFVAACADGTSSITGPSAAPAFSTSGAAPTLTIDQQLEREKQRIARAQEDSKAAYDSLKREWARLNRTYPNGNPELLYCDPLQYVGTAVIVGPEGGSISFGPHKLRIPRGALAARTVITAEAPTSLAVRAVFGPHGLQFALPAKLSLSYKHCNRPTSFTEGVAYTDDVGNILERPFSVDNTLSAVVDANINHFSGYTVTTNRTDEAH